MMTYKPSKLDHIDLVLVRYLISSEHLCIENYKPLRVAVMICPTLVNTQTDSILPVIL